MITDLITEDGLRQMGIHLMGLREQEKEKLDELEKIQLNIRRQEGAVMLYENLLQQQKRQQAAMNGADPQHAA